MPRLNGKADITLMRKDQNGNLVPSRDQTGKIQKVSPQQSKLQAMTILQDAISKGGEYEGEQPFDIMRTLVGKLKKDISSRSTAVKKEEFGPRLGRNRMRKSRMVANPDTNDGLLLIQLNGLEQNLIQRGSSKRGGLVTRTSGETDVDISNAAEQYLIYQELKNKMINSDAGVYGK